MLLSNHIPGEPIKFYVQYAQRMAQEERKTMYIDFNHLISYDHSDPKFLDTLVNKYYEFEKDLRRALEKLMS